MRRVSEVLPGVATQLGLDEELRAARAMAAWESVVGALVPAAAGTTRLLEVRPPELIVSARDARLGQELRLRSEELLAAFAASWEGSSIRRLHVMVGTSGGKGRPGGRSGQRV
jgi:hypothetical protein